MSRKTLLIPICFCALSMSVNAGTVVLTPNDTYDTKEVRKIAFNQQGKLSVTFTDGTSRAYELTSFQRIYFTEGSSTESFSPLGNKEMYLYPNPVSEILFVNGLTSGVSYKIYNMQGAVYMEGETSDGKISANVIDLPQGIYFLSIEGDVLKFIKR